MQRSRRAQWGPQRLSLFSLRRSLVQEIGAAAAVAVLALLVISGCGGANPNDVALITGAGGPGFTATTTPLPVATTPSSTPLSAGAPVAIQFVSAQPTSIGVQGSGLPEQSTLTFQVTDAFGLPVGGVPVTFTLTEIADESITPDQDTTDANGNAHVTLTSGQRTLTVQITAQVTTVTPPLTVRSTAVAILGGPPSQLHFSLAEQFLNISGRVLFGVTDQITAYVGDRFGNPVPPGTAVSFTTKGGAIGNLTSTNSLGQATGMLVSQAPVPSNGIVVTLATTHGERPFVDKDANGVCDAQDTLLKVSEPFYDTNCNGVHDADEDFIDLNGDGQFNDDQAAGTPACGDQVVLFENICTTFSGHTNVLLVASDSGPIPAGGSRDFILTISDETGNPIVGGSTLSISINGARGRLLGPTNLTLADAQTLGQIIDGINRFKFSVVDNAPTASTPETDAIIVTVTSAGLPAGGNGSVILTDVITFEAAAPPSATPNATATPITEPPAIVPGNATLAEGSGAPPNSCNGGSQTFVVTGGSPPFAVFGGGGCVSLGSVPVSGGSFIFIAGNIPGSYAITVSDALGRTASAGVTVTGPPTPLATDTAAPTMTAAPTATATPTLPANSVHFVSANPAAIGVRQSGLPEQSVLTFQVTDANSNPVAGVAVRFTLTGVDDESIYPVQTLTDAGGLARATVTTGVRAALIRVIAAADSHGNGLFDLFAQSTQVAVLGAPPAQNRFSVAAQKLNVAGRVFFGIRDPITAFVNDRFGNAVPPGTVVSFMSNGASVVNPAATDGDGVATATLITEAEVPPTGIVTVLAFTRGEEAFQDTNGNGTFDPGVDIILGDDQPEPFIDFRSLPASLSPSPPNDTNCPVPPPSWLCNNAFDPLPFELFVDANSNGIWDTQGVSGTWDTNILVSDTIPVTFSGHLVPPVVAPTTFTITEGGAQAFTLQVHDDLFNPLVGASTITVTATVGTVAGGSITVPDGESFNRLVDGLNRFTFVLSDNQAAGGAPRPLVPTTITVTVNSDNGDGTFIVASGLIPAQSAAAATPTPTPML